MIYYLILIPLKLEFLYIITFILVIAFLVQLAEMIIKKYSEPLYNALGIYLPLITTNCAVLGVALLNVKASYTFWGSVVSGIGGGVGFTIALLLMSGVRERLELMNVPKSFRGIPIAFIVAALMSLGFLGFAGMIK
jgi:electron transport complex protein RnfA